LFLVLLNSAENKIKYFEKLSLKTFILFITTKVFDKEEMSIETCGTFHPFEKCHKLKQQSTHTCDPNGKTQMEINKFRTILRMESVGLLEKKYNKAGNI
jgi:hypothetical protein